MSGAADCIGFTKRHTSAIVGSLVHESVLHEIAPRVEGANLHCCSIASIIGEGVGSLAGWALGEVVHRNCQITGGVLVRADGGQTAQEDDGYIEEELVPGVHYKIGPSCRYSDPETNFYCCLSAKLDFRLDMLGDTD